MSSIWETLSTIDCSKHIEKKGQFSYLAWTWAWAMVKERYPEAQYKLCDDIVYPDGTMEVRVEVEIHDAKQTGRPFLSHTMWLPVLDFKNKAIQHPNAFDINTARMRCLVKCLAMFGLGHYIYAGESLPAPSPQLQEDYETLVSLVANKKGWEVRKMVAEHPNMDELFNMSPDGKKTKFKQAVRDLYSGTNASLKDSLSSLEYAVGAEVPDATEVHEILSEMEPLEQAFVLDGCNEILRKQIEELLA